MFGIMTRFLSILTAGLALALASCKTGEDFASLDHALTNLMTPQAFSGDAETKLPSLAGHVNGELIKILPKVLSTADKLPGAAWRDRLDLTGVSIVRNNAWQDKKTATLIGDRWVIMAKHFQRAIGDEIPWRNASGEIVTRRLVAKASMTICDLTLGKLDRPVTGEGLTIYQVFPAGYNWLEALRWGLTVHTDQEDKVLIKRMVGAATLALGDGIVRQVDYAAPPSGFAALDESLVSGDSGNPFFVIYNGQQVLLGLHWTTRSGPFLSDPDVPVWIQETARSL